MTVERSCSSVFIEARQYPRQPEISCTDSAGFSLAGQESFPEYPDKANYKKLTLCVAKTVTCTLANSSEIIRIQVVEGKPRMASPYRD